MKYFYTLLTLFTSVGASAAQITPGNWKLVSVTCVNGNKINDLISEHLSDFNYSIEQNHLTISLKYDGIPLTTQYSLASTEDGRNQALPASETAGEPFYLVEKDGTLSALLDDTRGESCGSGQIALNMKLK